MLSVNSEVVRDCLHYLLLNGHVNLFAEVCHWLSAFSFGYVLPCYGSYGPPNIPRYIYCGELQCENRAQEATLHGLTKTKYI